MGGFGLNVLKGRIVSKRYVVKIEICFSCKDEKLVIFKTFDNLESRRAFEAVSRKCINNKTSFSLHGDDKEDFYISNPCDILYYKFQPFDYND